MKPKEITNAYGEKYLPRCYMKRCRKPGTYHLLGEVFCEEHYKGLCKRMKYCIG